MNLKNMLGAFGIGFTSEFSAKTLAEFLKGSLTKLSEDKLKQKFAEKGKMEIGRSRLVHALSDMGDKAKNLLKYHQMASAGTLFDLKGKPIKENRFVYLLSELDEARLEDTLRWLNDLPEEEFRQIMELLDENSWGDNVFKMKEKFKKAFDHFAHFFQNHLNLNQGSMKIFLDELKKKTKKSLRALKLETKTSVSEIKKIKF